MRKLLLLALALLPALSITSCTKRIYKKEGPPGADGQDGQDGTNGIDGRDGLNGIGFDYVRGMDGGLVCNRAIVIPAQFFLPEHILAFAPAEDPYDPDGLTLTFGTEQVAFRVYLGSVLAGEYCLVEKEHPGGWQPVGDPLVFGAPGFIALIPEETLMLLEPEFLALLMDNGTFIEFGPAPDESDVCKMLDYSWTRLSIGNKIRINFNGRCN